LVAGKCCADNLDSPQHQEILLPGYLLPSFLKEQFQEYLGSIQAHITSEVHKPTTGAIFSEKTFVTKAMGKVCWSLSSAVTAKTRKTELVRAGAIGKPYFD
jgi:DNA-directed RNA polymerase I subunit RPA2